VAQTLLANGWKEAYALKGGFAAWTAVGLPTEPRSKGK
jgi:rhodanese-related sulfurtransferase